MIANIAHKNTLSSIFSENKLDLIKLYPTILVDIMELRKLPENCKSIVNKQFI